VFVHGKAFHFQPIIILCQLGQSLPLERYLWDNQWYQLI